MVVSFGSVIKNNVCVARLYFLEDLICYDVNNKEVFLVMFLIVFFSTF